MSYYFCHLYVADFEKKDIHTSLVNIKDFLNCSSNCTLHRESIYIGRTWKLIVFEPVTALKAYSITSGQKLWAVSIHPCHQINTLSGSDPMLLPIWRQKSNFRPSGGCYETQNTSLVPGNNIEPYTNKWMWPQEITFRVHPLYAWTWFVKIYRQYSGGKCLGIIHTFSESLRFGMLRYRSVLSLSFMAILLTSKQCRWDNNEYCIINQYW